jgi:hypothetical protein
VRRTRRTRDRTIPRHSPSGSEPPAEGEMFVGVVALNVERVAASELTIVAIGRSYRHQEPCADRKINATDRDRLLSDAALCGTEG